MKDSLPSIHHSSFRIHHFSFVRPAGPEDFRPAAHCSLLAEDRFERAGVEPDAAAGVAAVNAHIVVGLFVEPAGAARAVHRDWPLAPLARLLAQSLAQARERLLVLTTEILLFESPPAFVENVCHGLPPPENVGAGRARLPPARARRPRCVCFDDALSNSRKVRRSATPSPRRDPCAAATCSISFRRTASAEGLKRKGF